MKYQVIDTRFVMYAIFTNTLLKWEWYYDKFPKGYIITVNNAEKKQLVEIFDRFNSLKHSTAPVKAFTEKGLYMLATILKSPQATQTTLAIIETFAKIREMTRTVGA